MISYQHKLAWDFKQKAIIFQCWLLMSLMHNQHVHTQVLQHLDDFLSFVLIG